MIEIIILKNNSELIITIEIDSKFCFISILCSILMMAGVSQVFMWTRNITFNYENILMSITCIEI